ncbi:TctA family transporter [Paraburkholderia sp. BL27I4N3]|uniref:tripartite tricarboxylate transporter permease n=1 Tax=Paraburkholderia sp. BL27I4N3 TaxID=1938805 RepID=UPI000E287CDD|nr:tripartite tricarboxylate transporter permease [Paraburkholderia sp. BL27I4N3]REE21462.1 TctA family transporter [Paraburkholderia sp. BL27I4N3]
MEFFNDATLMAAGHALSTLLQFNRLIFLVFGVTVGLAIGLLPGIGGLTGFALLVPFTYTMDPVAAFAMLLGMASVITTSDVIPAVLFGVPGHAASQATVLDGLPMTKRGEASRALSACYTSSLLGGLIGAVMLAISLPLVRPFVLSIGTPEMLGLTIFGVSMVSALSGNAPLRGVVAACFGILVGMIGTNVETGQMRWTGDILYLQDGIPLVPIILGIFALPELCELAIRRTAIAEKVQFNSREGMRQGVIDGLRNWFLVLRCGGLGALLGVVPGITGAVTDWIAYGHALQTSKGAKQTFTTGDVRGVIAPEAANNAREGGSLVPMLAFGVPGGAAQAILLGAMMVHGFIPGPDMLTKHLAFTYSMVWSIALANIFGAGLCFLLSGQFAKVSTLRYTLILPVIMPIIYVGAFQGSRSWGDLFVLLTAAAIGWTMKRLKWARPPLILGLVLGTLMERYMTISFVRYGTQWMTRPIVMVLLILAALVFFKPLFNALRSGGLARMRPSGKIVLKPEDLVYVFFIGIGLYTLVSAQSWLLMAKIGPTVIASILVLAGSFSLAYKMFFIPATAGSGHAGGGIHMDVSSDHGEKLPNRVVLLRAAKFFGWFIGFLVCMSVIGLIPTVPIVIVAYMRIEGRESWKLCVILAACVTALIYGVFDRIIHIPWPSSLL